MFQKKANALDQLEGVDKQIKNIEEFSRDTETARKRVVGRFVIISLLIYLVVAFLFYFFFFPATFYDQLVYLIPLILAPVM